MEKYPQWMKSRLNSLKDLPECKTTHYACRCFIKKIIELEAELVCLRKEKDAKGVGAQETGLCKQ
jgi:hypothetical protein